MTLQSKILPEVVDPPVCAILQATAPAAPVTASAPTLDLAAELAALPGMTLPQLRARWRRLTDSPVPKVKMMLLRHALAYQFQAAAYGGLSRQTERRLAQLASGGSLSGAMTDVRLAREWKGVLHTVTIDRAGVIAWEGREWNSLSEVARAITGKRWSGPMFFGLKDGSAAA